MFYDVEESAGSRRNNATLNASAVAAALSATPRGGAVPLTIVTESLGIHKGAGVNNGPTPETFSTSAVQVAWEEVAAEALLAAQNLFYSRESLPRNPAPSFWARRTSQTLAGR